MSDKPSPPALPEPLAFLEQMYGALHEAVTLNDKLTEAAEIIKQDRRIIRAILYQMGGRLTIYPEAWAASLDRTGFSIWAGDDEAGALALCLSDIPLTPPPSEETAAVYAPKA